MQVGNWVNARILVDRLRRASACLSEMRAGSRAAAPSTFATDKSVCNQGTPDRWSVGPAGAASSRAGREGDPEKDLFDGAQCCIRCGLSPI